MKTITILALAFTLASCSMERTLCVNYADSIHNPSNDEYVEEVAFNLGITPDKVTQEQFNERYGIGE